MWSSHTSGVNWSLINISLLNDPKVKGQNKERLKVEDHGDVKCSVDFVNKPEKFIGKSSIRPLNVLTFIVDFKLAEIFAKFILEVVLDQRLIVQFWNPGDDFEGHQVNNCELHC